METTKILMADDCVEFCESIRDLISQQADMELVGIAYNGEEAYEKICTLLPDVVLLDNCMPYMDGFDVVRKLQENKDLLPRFPVILMISALNREKTMQTAMRLGVDYYMVKPIDFRGLLDRIKQFSVSEPETGYRIPAPQTENLETRVTKIMHEVAVPRAYQGVSVFA